MLNDKRAETKIMTVIAWIAIIGIIAYATNMGGFKNTVNSWLTPGAVTQPPQPGLEVLTDTKDCPTDLTTTYTINVEDALATTATSLYPEYYIFNGNQLIKTGTLSSTASTVSLSCGKDYDVLLINTTAGNGNGMYPEIINLKARIAQQTINVPMTLTGTAKIYKVVNPLEGAASAAYANMTIGADTTKSWEIQFNANNTARGFNRPIIMCQVNVTEIQTMDMTAFDDGKTPVDVTVLPRRKTARAGKAYYAWEYPGMLDPTQPMITGKGSITSTTTGPIAAVTSNMSCIMADQQTWRIAQYKTAGSIAAAFKTGPENTETNADVGAPDASEVDLVFLNANGV